MSFIAKMKLGDNLYTVLNADYEVSQPLGHRNMPNDQPHLGLINITVASSGKEELFAWAVSAKTTKNGEIIFYRSDVNSAMKTLKFTDAFCVRYKEIFQADGEVPMRIQLTLSARMIECMGVSRWELWPGYENSSGSKSSAAGEEKISSFNPNS
ncbi:MAG TPA: type VI secretion system tube protein TssD [Phnomibacter sp.]|nr:type VI secretion system tube protein TssD [Phnomibacter sp.]